MNETHSAPIESSPSSTKTRRKPKKHRMAAATRWIHIYASMIGLAVTLFFSVTGITLNHPDWFYPETPVTRESTGKISPQWLGTSGENSTEPEKLEIVEFLRREHQLSGAVQDFDTDEYQIVVTFAGPGYSSDAFIDRETGTYQLTEIYQGFVAVINDLHKGRDSGAQWSILIDVSAIMLTIISVTGLILLFWLKRKRLSGLITAFVGTIVVVAIFLWSVS